MNTEKKEGNLSDKNKELAFISRMWKIFAIIYSFTPMPFDEYNLNSIVQPFKVGMN